ncbi:NAD(P)H-hydrate epimerase [Albidovulum sp.]|uniref:NAD(P)H-hydrate epimerase n=1 Tax=Albidovulum sp. TaxID=1872424 RepID=UPI002B5F79E5|nr:NAD(P)H-hydrate epimerase [Albidovulum sp.]
MTELLTAAQMRAIEQAAIASGEVTGLELMERAGRGVVEAIFEEWPELAKTSHRAVVLCGPGNNGGDGFVVARLLKEQGWEVALFLYGNPERLPPDARANYERWFGMGDVHPFTDRETRDPLLCDPHPDLWVDAIFGIGQNRPLPELVTKMLHRIYYEQNWCTAPVVAVDIPTGLASDTGQSVQTFHLTSDLTVTFHAGKHGQYVGDGPLRCGKVVVKDIGL